MVVAAGESVLYITCRKRSEELESVLQSQRLLWDGIETL